jgi:hypothetical protein
MNITFLKKQNRTKLSTKIIIILAIFVLSSYTLLDLLYNINFNKTFIILSLIVNLFSLFFTIKSIFKDEHTPFDVIMFLPFINIPIFLLFLLI